MKSFLWVGCFISILLFFFISGRWYEPNELIIEGSANNKVQVLLQWDSGAGYNMYESENFSFSPQTTASNKELPLSIRYLNKKNPASLSTHLVVTQIIVDGVSQNLSSFTAKEGGYKENYGVHLSHRYPSLDLMVPVKSQVEIEILTNNHSGIAGVLVGSDYSEKDLYVANEEAKQGIFKYWLLDENDRFSVKATIPRYEIDRFKLHSKDSETTLRLDAITLKDTYGNHFPVVFKHEGADVFFSLHGIRAYHYWNATQFIFQILFTIITVWIIIALYRQLESIGGLGHLLDGRRKVFWALFAGSIVSFAF